MATIASLLFTQKFMDISQTDAAIAKGKILGFLLMSRQPVTINVAALADRLQLTPALVTKALQELEAETRATVTILKAIVSLSEVAPEPPPESEKETTPAQGIRGAKP
jgi:hypothetical protein